MVERAPIILKHTTAAIVRTHNTLRMSVILTKTKLLVKGLDDILVETSCLPPISQLVENEDWMRTRRRAPPE